MLATQVLVSVPGVPERHAIIALLELHLLAHRCFHGLYAHVEHFIGFMVYSVILQTIS